MLTGVTTLSLNNPSLLKKRSSAAVEDPEDDIVVKVVQEEVKKEAVRIKDLGNAFGEDGENVMSLKNRFAPEGKRKIQKVESQPTQGIDVYDSSDSEEAEKRPKTEPKSESKWAAIYGESADTITGSIGHSV